MDRTGDRLGTPGPQKRKEEMVEEFRETSHLGEPGECEEHLVSRQQVITELESEAQTEPEQEPCVPTDCKEQEHGRELVSLDIPDFLLSDAPEEKNGG